MAKRKKGAVVASDDLDEMLRPAEDSDESFDVGEDIINDDAKGTWRAALTIKQVLLAVQLLLDDVNNADPAQTEAWQVFSKDQAEYKRRVKAQVQRLQQAH